MAFRRIADLRYVGQGYELKIPVPSGHLTEEGLKGLWAAFHAAHAAEYGHAFEANPIEIVNLRVSGLGEMPKIGALRPPAGGSLEEALLRRGPSLFRAGGALRSFDTPVYRRERLPVDIPFEGPAIILQKDSTTVVTPGATARVHASGSILITLGDAR